MRTSSKEKIAKAERLLSLIQNRIEIEKEEKELKGYFKDASTDGVIEAGDVIILIETKVRTNLDRNGLAKLLGEKIKAYESQTKYEQVTVKGRAA